MSDSCNPTDCSQAASSVHRISLARILEWVAMSFSRYQALGKYKSKSQWASTSRHQDGCRCKRIASVGEDVGKLGPSHTTSGKVTRGSFSGKQGQSLPSNLPAGVSPIELKTGIQTNMCIHMFIAALSTKPRGWTWWMFIHSWMGKQTVVYPHVAILFSCKKEWFVYNRDEPQKHELMKVTFVSPTFQHLVYSDF